MPQLFLVSNRLPFTIRKKGDTFALAESIGGLSTALTSVSRHFRSTWVGASGVTDRQLDRAKTQIHAFSRQHSCGIAPIPINTPGLAASFNSFCNGLLWPFLHGMPQYASPSLRVWPSYVRLNRIFCEYLLRLSNVDDVLWINDYHLFLLPKMIRFYRPHAKIGFFLHVPFPAPSLFNQIAFSRQLMDGLRASDVIGVYTDEFKANLRACISVSSPIGAFDRINLKGLEDGVDVFPLGIDPSFIVSTISQPYVAEKLVQLRDKYSGKYIILSADRLDYTKGILNKLKAFDEYLCKNRHKRAVKFVVVIAKSRMRDPAYMQLFREINVLVNAINARHNASETPLVELIARQLSYRELLAYYAIADMFVVGSIRDGMNIMAKEFLAVRGHDGGALVLSKRAGAAYELPDAFLVEPNEMADIVRGMEQAIGETAATIAKRNVHMLRTLETQTAQRWAHDFLSRILSRTGAQPMVLEQLGRNRRGAD